jgi:hypothetical protein
MRIRWLKIGDDLGLAIFQNSEVIFGKAGYGMSRFVGDHDVQHYQTGIAADHGLTLVRFA